MVQIRTVGRTGYQYEILGIACHPFHVNGKTLYFTSNRKGGFGEMDIYRSVLQDNGQWGQPVNLGNVINSALNEDTPFITENDSVLYFSSQGHENMGGYDIFKSKIGPANQWSTPENLKYPINTTDDNLFYYPLA